MTEKDFIFIPGFWLGEGKISFSASPEFIKFYTKWKITEEAPGIMIATQIVEMQGMEEQVINTFTFKDILPTSFTVYLENNLLGSVVGKGIRDEHTIAWEFRNQSIFEGFEVYEQQENGDYFLHAEYGSPDQFRTVIEGLVWRKGH
jgi:hypothetical protein